MSGLTSRSRLLTIDANKKCGVDNNMVCTDIYGGMDTRMQVQRLMARITVSMIRISPSVPSIIRECTVVIPYLICNLLLFSIFFALYI
jgi:hypothetical protein